MAAKRPDPLLKRESAGRYVSPDGRFSVEQSSGRWMVADAESVDDFGLPLMRGPFATLDDAKAAIEGARSGPAPTSDLAARTAARPAGDGRPGAKRASATRGRARKNAPDAAAGGGTKRRISPRAPTVELRDVEPTDGEALRRLWQEAGLNLAGDGNADLKVLAARNPGLLVVGTADGEIVASALGAWDGRRGWIDRLAVAPKHRRTGIGGRLVRRIEQRLRALGCPKVNVVVREESADADAFFASIGYSTTPARLMGKEL